MGLSQSLNILMALLDTDSLFWCHIYFLMEKLEAWAFRRMIYFFLLRSMCFVSGNSICFGDLGMLYPIFFFGCICVIIWEWWGVLCIISIEILVLQYFLSDVIDEIYVLRSINVFGIIGHVIWLHHIRFKSYA